MKRLLSITFIIVTVYSLSAQILNLQTDTVQSAGNTSDVEIITNNHVFNNTNDTVYAMWERVAENIPVGWTGTAICDNNTCYFTDVSVAPIPFILTPRGNSILDVHFQPAGVEGSGEVELRIWVVGDSANTVISGVYKADAEQAVGINNLASENIKIYPNPARDFVLIKNLPDNQINTIEVYNIFGRKMASFVEGTYNSSEGARKLNIEILPKGIYMIRVYDQNMNLLHTKSISKE